MDNTNLTQAVGFLKRTIYFSRLLNALKAAEKAVVIGAAALTLTEAVLIIRGLNK